MSLWRPQPFRTQALADGRNEDVVVKAIATAEAMQAKHADLPPVFTLKHLALMANADYALLRNIVARNDIDPYRTFRIRKRPAYDGEIRYRIIAVPRPTLLRTQRWITQSILAKVKPHSASTAFSKGDKLFDAVAPHCGCRWLIKLDVRNFFESINEVAAYRVFRALGYQALIAFEMTRLCTRLGSSSRYRAGPRWHVRFRKWTTIKAYGVYRGDPGPTVGHLPQGAPTSPMLANLAVREFDARVQLIATKHGLTYTRYADDLTLSTVQKEFTRVVASRVIRKVHAAMRDFGLFPNVAKTRVTPPGARKVVLGLLVDTKTPRLPREFKASMRQHIHYLTKEGVGSVAHARRRGFSSVVGFRHYLQGLLSFAKQIEPDYARACEADLADVDWPL
jgi:RNA-directed DNA polymerase